MIGCLLLFFPFNGDEYGLDSLIIMYGIALFLILLLYSMALHQWKYYKYFKLFYEYVDSTMAKELFKLEVKTNDYKEFIVYLHNIMYTIPGMKVENKVIILPENLHNKITNYIGENYNISEHNLSCLDRHINDILFLGKTIEDTESIMKYYKKLDKFEYKIRDLKWDYEKYLDKIKECDYFNFM